MATALTHTSVVVAGALTALACGPSAPATAPATVPVSSPQTAPTTQPEPSKDRIVLVGDSLAQEAAPYIEHLTPTMTVVPRYWGGTAPCDWLDDDLWADASSVVVLSFTGNSLTSCMTDDAGRFLADDALVARYRADLDVLVGRVRAAGARVVLVGQPFRAPSFDAEVEVAGINRVLRDLAAADAGVVYVDAGAAVETVEGRYTERLPCGPFDPVCDLDGMTVVRGDGVHFCPEAGMNPCPVWSSGAFRFASAIVGAIESTPERGC